ncbi:MAG: peptide-methionine (S)-S-oxide reductase MsrA [Cytophagales bacterium]|nr:peptide-methionine (S)-S-oxide reductase MsrA [Cytophagales bacterium]
MEKATFGGGCFWCVEAIFQELEGVSTVISGYAGGHTENPRYVEVCKGYTGHAEVVQITFDPSVITFKELLEVFFKTHDPTSLNRQGADTGTQYRSIVLYHSEEQKKQTEEYIDQLDNSGTYRKLIVTEVSPLKIFYEAEAGHQDYFANNKGKQPYCSFVIQPKLTKFQKAFSEKLKKK